MIEMDTDYEVFVSYSKEDREWASELLDAIQDVFKKSGGRELRIFMYTQDIKNGEAWEQHIGTALEKSYIMLAILSPAYFHSSWCKREWTLFCSLEEHKRTHFDIQPFQRLIFPVEKEDFSRTLQGTSGQIKKLIDQARQIQCIDFKNKNPADKEFTSTANDLANTIIDLLNKKRNPQESIPDILPTVPFREGTNKEQFIKCLTSATKITIVGMTHSNLVKYLEEALEQKRKKEGRRAFWNSLNIIFLSECILEHVNDELLTTFPTSESAIFERIRDSGRSKRVISHFLLRQNVPTRWRLYEYNYMLPFVGAMFHSNEGNRIVQVATLRSGYSASEFLYYEFSDSLHDGLSYYEAAFEDIIAHSEEHNEIVLIGNPSSHKEDEFVVNHTRFRRGVFKEGGDTELWVACVTILLWVREKSGEIKPLVQIRTSENASRELDKLSNISGYINAQDCGYNDLNMEDEYQIQESDYLRAVQRELKDELGVDKRNVKELKLLKKIEFYYPDKENLFFYVCQARLTKDAHVRAQLQPRTFKFMCDVRKYQVMSFACKLLERVGSSHQPLDRTAQIIAYNLILHDEKEFAAKVLDAVRSMSKKDSSKIVEEMATWQKRNEKHYSPLCHNQNTSTGRPKILGWAELQYREFFSSLVPAYAELGVEGALDCLHELETKKKDVLAQLIRHYRSYSSICEIWKETGFSV